ncbi:hypothetical protein FISHEDRAFT_76969 [Fistulina hepatica ATCC 64428]|uniref:Reverse transcriptase Ty1/copia-type domain-containing protein n=1 Tax=Fistulina hepatica ATCC 64428 TaxID=1128425 RepID=A0A0D7A5D7_9AGAR|nr:hypothetical protein FISHEDRAFT_76969 [Fistulina hepatica ATCC 64428]
MSGIPDRDESWSNVTIGHFKQLHEGHMAKTALVDDPGGDMADDELYEYALLASEEGPATFKEAVEGDEADDWKAAIWAEIEQIEGFGMWEIVECLRGVNVVRSRYVFCQKLDANGNIAKFKVQFIACGYSQ